MHLKSYTLQSTAQTTKIVHPWTTYQKFTNIKNIHAVSLRATIAYKKKLQKLKPQNNRKLKKRRGHIKRSLWRSKCRVRDDKSRFRRPIPPKSGSSGLWLVFIGRHLDGFAVYVNSIVGHHVSRGDHRRDVRRRRRRRSFRSD